MSTRRPPKVCSSFNPGHMIHWIHARKSAEEPGPLVAVRVERVDPDGRITLTGESGEFHLFSHDPIGLADAVSDDAHYRPRWHLLSTRAGTFNVSVDELEPCREPPRGDG